MRTTSSLWRALACVLIAATVAVGKATAAATKRMPVHHKGRSHPRAHLLGQRAAAIARRMVGVPYRWGGSSPSGFDCSGLVMFAYGRLGVTLPHSSYELFRVGRTVGRWALRPGDLVFFHGGGHVGLYLGHSRFVAATHTGDHVRISSLRDRWYADTYEGARRLPSAGERRPV
jgi:cell wall-associated NlpC family hydrolase